MDNPETLATLSSQDIERRLKKKTKKKTHHINKTWSILANLSFTFQLRFILMSY